MAVFICVVLEIAAAIFLGAMAYAGCRAAEQRWSRSPGFISGAASLAMLITIGVKPGFIKFSARVAAMEMAFALPLLPAALGSCCHRRAGGASKTESSAFLCMWAATMSSALFFTWFAMLISLVVVPLDETIENLIWLLSLLTPSLAAYGMMRKRARV